ncbi:hypothetical protein [Pseudomonas sp. FFUP_PS_473]|nr:hypothetical protein [Pseudomonas sp. FFUP_PS_473]
MNSVSLQCRSEMFEESTSMQAFGEMFIEALPKHVVGLRIPGRLITDGFRRAPLFAQIEQVPEIQSAMHEVLCHSITQEAQSCAERAFRAFLKKDKADTGVLKFFNGWN